MKVYSRSSHGVQLPTCAVCGEKVMGLTVQEDDFMKRLVIVARCHGEIERILIGMDEARGLNFAGLAFASSARRLPPGPVKPDAAAVPPAYARIVRRARDE